MPKAIIFAKDLSKTYPGDGVQVQALSDVNLQVRQSQIVAVMGPSGSGKTTLLNLIGTLESPSSGEILVDSMDVSQLSGNELADFRRERIGFIFQLYNLIPTLTALENVMLPLIPFRRKCGFDLESRARELLAAMEMDHRTDHLPGQLSGGEQQRVAIARALVNDPAIILADEPTGNIDTRAGDIIMELLQRICDDMGQTVVVSTHDPRVAAFAEKIFFLRDGSIDDECWMSSEMDRENEKVLIPKDVRSGFGNTP